MIPRTPAPASARLGAQLEQLYAEGKFTEILAHLAERILEMNKQKQQEIKGFLSWLEGYLDAKVRTSRPRPNRKATTSTITMG